jgi:hypothetical protein
MLLDHLLVLVAIIIGTSLAAGVRAYWGRRRMSKALGRQVSNSELTSLNVWMEVDREEKKNAQTGPPL